MSEDANADYHFVVTALDGREIHLGRHASGPVEFRFPLEEVEAMKVGDTIQRPARFVPGEFVKLRKEIGRTCRDCYK